MKILKIIHGYPPNKSAGSEVYSLSICNELSKEHQISVFTREENIYETDFRVRNHIENENLHFYHVNMRSNKDGYKHSKLDFNFNKVVQEVQPDIAHIGHLNHLSTGIIDVLYKNKIPIVFTLHDFWLMCPRGQFLQRNFGQNNYYELCDRQENKKCATQCYNAYFSGQAKDYERDLQFWTSWIHTRMIEIKSIVQKTDLFIAPSRYLMNRFINDFQLPKEKIIHLDYGFPTRYLTSVTKNPREHFTFGYIGTHISGKGVNLLIEAFKELENKASLKIWGQNNGQNTMSLKKLSHDSHNPIEFQGEYINKNIATEVFANVDCIVMPSVWAENSPLVIHEAQASKVPVITANYGGMSEYVRHLENGLLFEHRDIIDLTNKMNFAIQNPGIMRKLGEKGYLYSKNGQVITIEEHCNILTNLYQNVIQQYEAKSTLANDP